MAKVRKVNYDPNSVESGGNFVHHPAPALVRVKCTKADLDFTSSTGNDGVHLEFQIVGSKPAKKGQQWSTLHHYLTFTDAAQWREVEMMEALIGKRVKTYKDTDLVGKVCLAKLRPEEYEGETQAKISRLLNLDTDDEDDDDIEDDDDDAADEPDEDDDDSDDEEDAADDYNDWSLAQLRAELESRELETTGRKKALVKRLEDHDASDDDEADDDDEDEDAPDYESMGIRELRAAAKEAGIATRGLDKDALIEALEEEPDDDDDDEDEDDAEEATDYSEWSLKDLRAEAKERGINTRGLDKDGLAEALSEDDGDPFTDDDE